MNRSLTNAIRFVMDECLPPVIRDSRWFMYPFFYIWFKGKNLPLYMDFKSLVHRMTPEEYAAAYRDLDSRATDRPTDMNEPTIRALIKNIDANTATLLDVGCGRGYLLERIMRERTNVACTGVDVLEKVEVPGANYVSGIITNLPFPDASFDTVVATCILEHIVDLGQAVRELKRVARKQVIIVVPRQRYYYYTLDMHVHFFPIKEDVAAMMDMAEHSCEEFRGDWLYVGKK